MKLVHVLVGTLVLFAGCSQGEGDRCQIDSDCSSGLICTGSATNRVCKPKGTPGTGGSTGQTSSTSSTRLDAGAKADATSEASNDATAVSSDASGDETTLSVDADVKRADTLADRPASVREAGSDVVSREASSDLVSVVVDAPIAVSVDASDVAAAKDAAVDLPDGDVAADADALLTD